MGLFQQKTTNEMKHNTLTDLANFYQSDKGTIAPKSGHHGPRLHFTPIYEKYMDVLRNESLTILEIGVGSGASIKMWYDYFPNAKIHAIDVKSQSHLKNDRVTTHVCDQSNRLQLSKVMEQIGNVDIIIDDGSHAVAHQQISLGVLFKFLKTGGQYWIEDLHTSDKSVWNGKTLYGYDMSFNDGESTVDVLEYYIENGVFLSPNLTDTENAYLSETIKKCTIFPLPYTFYGINKLALIEKQ